MFGTLVLSGAIALGQPPVSPPVAPPVNPAASPAYVAVPVLVYQNQGSPNPTIVVGGTVQGAPQPMPMNAVQPGMQQNGSGNGTTNTNGCDKNGNGAEEKKEPEKFAPTEWLRPRPGPKGFMRRLYAVYYGEFFPSGEPEPETPPAPRRGMPEAWPSPPFPGSEFQGYPLIGVPPPEINSPIMKAIYGADAPWSEAIKDSRIAFQGWVTTAGNWSTAKNTNVPTSYWIVPNRYELDQLVFKLERVADTVQTDHWDWGFRSIALYGMDYRYTTAGGWGSDQLLKHNLLYGWDPVEQYFNVYIPGFLQGTDIRIGRWIACPDIETQYAPDNYMGSHSILFTYDTYTQTGVMVSQKITDRIMLQGVVHAGTDMAPWYPGALWTGAAGLRWVSRDNNDAFYTWVNAANSARFRHFDQYGQPLGHDNFNYVVTTWEHRFNKDIHTKTEAYYMWQYNAELGGTPSAGPVQPFGGGGGDGITLPGLSRTYGILNYTMFAFTKNDYATVRNEVYRDERGMRTGFAGTYTSHTIGLSHNFNSVFQIRPEIGYYRNWHQDAFDGGKSRGLVLYGFDMTYHF
jgi:hypothetical protein